MAGVVPHPQAVQFLAPVRGNPPLDTQSAERNRADLDAAPPLATGGASLTSVENAGVPGPGGEVPVRIHRLLVYPVVEPSTGTTDSYDRFGTSFFLTRRDMEHFYSLSDDTRRQQRAGETEGGGKVALR